MLLLSFFEREVLKEAELVLEEGLLTIAGNEQREQGRHLPTLMLTS